MSPTEFILLGIAGLLALLGLVLPYGATLLVVAALLTIGVVESRTLRYFVSYFRRRK